MAEPKRLSFTTVTQAKETKPKKKDSKTVRLQLTLKPSTDTTCPEFFYTDLVKNELGETKTPNGDVPNPDDPFGDDEDHEKLAALAKSFEEKYAPKPGKKGKSRAGRITDLVDLGDGYDQEDPFIDNSEAYDEVVPLCLTTKLGGFYINSGKLDFKDISDDSGDEFIFLKKKKKKRVIASDSESENEEHRKKKKRKLKMGDVTLEKKRNLLNGEAEKSFKKPKMPTDKDKQQQKKKKISPPVADVTKQQSNTSLSQTNGNTHDLDLISPSSNDDSSQDAQTYDERIDAVIDSVIAMADSDKNIESMIDNPLGFKDDSNSKEGKVMDEASAPKLPENMPKDLEETIQKLKKAAKTSQDGKCKFFTKEVNSMLLNVETGSRLWGSCGQRSSIYSHLAAFLPCSKDTLLKRAKKLQQSLQDDQLKEPIQKLREAINGMMPALQARHEQEYQAFLQKQKEEKGSKDEQGPKEGVNDTEDSDEEKTEGSKRGAPKGPRRKFIWTESVRSLLCDIVRIKMKNFDLLKTKTQSADEFLKQFLDKDIKPLWPKGWMQTRNLIKESRSVHSQWTTVQKVKKQTNLIINKTTPGGMNSTQNSQSSSSVPKFVPGSSPVRLPAEDIVSKDKVVTPRQPVKSDPLAVHNYAGKQPSKPSVSQQSGSGSKLGEVKVSEALGLSLLASSAASQKYIDKSWGHEVNDIIRASLTSRMTDNKKKEDPPSASAKSFIEQFQTFASSMIQKQLTEEAAKPQEISPKKKDLTLETKSYTQQQLLNRLQSVAAHQAKPETPTYSHQATAKPGVVKSVAPPAHQSKPQSNLPSQTSPSAKRTSISDEVYRKFLMESGVQLPPAHSNKPNTSSSLIHGASGTIKVSTIDSKSDKTRASMLYPTSLSNSRPAQSLYNTPTVTRVIQAPASTHVVQKAPASTHVVQKAPASAHLVQKAPGSTHVGQKAPQVKVAHESRTSPMQGQRSMGQSSMSSSNPIPKMDSKTAELIQQMMSNSSSSHSQVKQISPTSYQGKSVSPSSLYKSSPQATLSPQTWSVASLLSNTAPGMISPSLSNPAPGYQTLKLTNFTRDSPASPSIHPPSVVSPGMYPPTSPLLPGMQNPLLQGRQPQPDKSKSPHGY
ncbi:ubinuclein-1-like isoform X2 [Crassostrea angulata]|uniref:ubinuclein-1-like isoform X2 n=1 Tax=Magallana angulata TaxID=2784310 RepID=UPI0022B0CCAE|nr:ubinuclein-1-like isoform X2 [Crassostrea angulata]